MQGEEKSTVLEKTKSAQSSNSCEGSSSSSSRRDATEGKIPIPFPEIYRGLAFNCALKTGGAFLVSGLTAAVLLKGRGVRFLVFGLGGGTGLGWSLKEADEYLKLPRHFQTTRPPPHTSSCHENPLCRSLESAVDFVRRQWTKKDSGATER